MDTAQALEARATVIEAKEAVKAAAVKKTRTTRATATKASAAPAPKAGGKDAESDDDSFDDGEAADDDIAAPSRPRRRSSLALIWTTRLPRWATRYTRT